MDDREWEIGRKKAVDLFSKEAEMCEKKLKELKSKVGGGWRLSSLMSYVRGLEEREAERKAKKLAKGNEDESPEIEPDIESYRYSAAQIHDGG